MRTFCDWRFIYFKITNYYLYKHITRISSVLILTSIFSVDSALSASIIAVPGGTVGSVIPPSNPWNSEQCNEFVQESAVYLRRVSRFHDECLKENSGKSISKKKIACSYEQCEFFHIARDRFNEATRQEAQTCYEAAQENRRSLLNQISDLKAAKVDLKDFSNRSQAKSVEVLKKSLDLLFGSRLKKEESPNAAGIRIAMEIVKARASCQRRASNEVSAACEKQVLVSVAEMADGAFGMNGSSSIVQGIQRTAFERINSINTDSIRILDTFLGASEPQKPAIEDDSGGTLGR